MEDITMALSLLVDYSKDTLWGNTARTVCTAHQTTLGDPRKDRAGFVVLQAREKTKSLITMIEDWQARCAGDDIADPLREHTCDDCGCVPKKQTRVVVYDAPPRVVVLLRTLGNVCSDGILCPLALAGSSLQAGDDGNYSLGSVVFNGSASGSLWRAALCRRFPRGGELAYTLTFDLLDSVVDILGSMP
jgi:hypothetical protein